MIGAAAGSGDIAAAGGKPGALVAWEGTRGAVRVIRRGTSSTLRFGKTVTARRASGADLSGMTAALDPNGIAYIAWREGSGLEDADPRRARQGGAEVHGRSGRGRRRARQARDHVAADRREHRRLRRGDRLAGAQGPDVRRAADPVDGLRAGDVRRPFRSRGPFLSAGPGSHADMAWLQPSDGGPGYDVMQSTEVDP